MPVQSTSETSARQASAIQEEAKRVEQQIRERVRMDAAEQSQADEAAQTRQAGQSAETPPSPQEEPTNKPHRDDIELRDASFANETWTGSVVDDVV